jgi:hypothetical protein
MRPLDWGGVGGFAFVALNLLDVFTLLNTLDSHKSKSEFASYYEHFRGTSHEWRELVGTLVASLAAFAFVWFLRRLRALLRPADEGLAMLAFAGGFLFLALYMAAIVASTAVGTTLAYSDDFQVNLDTAILLSNISLFLITAAAAAFAVTAWASSLAAYRGRLLPRWLVWGGFATAIAALAMIAIDGLAVILILLWILALSVVFLRIAEATRSLATPSA